MNKIVQKLKKNLPTPVQDVAGGISVSTGFLTTFGSAYTAILQHAAAQASIYIIPSSTVNGAVAIGVAVTQAVGAAPITAAVAAGAAGGVVWSLGKAVTSTAINFVNTRKEHNNIVKIQSLVRKKLAIKSANFCREKSRIESICRLADLEALAQKFESNSNTQATSGFLLDKII